MSLSICGGVTCYAKVMASFNLYPESSGSFASGWLAEETLGGETMQSRYWVANQKIAIIFDFPRVSPGDHRWLKSLGTLGTRLD